MPSVLGSGINTAAIYTRNGRDRLLPLGGVSVADADPGISELSWGRAHNDLSTAFVQLAGVPEGLRQKQLNRIHTWANSLVMFRDGRRVWEGPIKTVDQGRDGLRIDAIDVSGWMSRRAIRRKRKTKKKVEVRVISEMELDVRRAFSPDNPNVTAHLQVFTAGGGGPTTVRDVGAYSGYYLDDLKTLCEDGGNFTTLGRSIIIWPDEHVLGKLRTLDGDTYIVGELHVTEIGDDLWTRTTAINEKGKIASRNGAGGDVNAAGVSPFYGMHHRRYDAGHAKTRSALATRARKQENRHYPAPTVVEVPAGAQLDPATPIRIDQLVAGVTIPVSSRLRGYLAKSSLLLENVTVTQNAQGESVAVTFANPSVDTDDTTA